MKGEQLRFLLPFRILGSGGTGVLSPPPKRALSGF